MTTTSTQGPRSPSELSDDELFAELGKSGVLKRYEGLEDKVIELIHRYKKKKKELEQYGDHNCKRRNFGPGIGPCECGFSEVCKASGIPDKA